MLVSLIFIGALSRSPRRRSPVFLPNGAARRSVLATAAKIGRTPDQISFDSSLDAQGRRPWCRATGGRDSRPSNWTQPGAQGGLMPDPVERPSNRHAVVVSAPALKFFIGVVASLCAVFSP